MEKVKYFLKQIKNHAGLIISFIFLIIVSFISIILFQQKNNILNLLERQTQNYRKEIDDLRALRDADLQERIQLERRYQAELDRLNREHQLQLLNLDKDKETLVKDVLKETKDSPEKAAQRINEIFGIPVQK
jgi:biopolymer transport protein ExbB/TolQ